MSPNHTPVVISDYPYAPKQRKSFSNAAILKIVSADFIQHEEEYNNRIIQMAEYAKYFHAISISQPADSLNEPFWENGWLPPLDAISIYATLAHCNPRYYVECGSGNTTKFAARAIRDHKLRTKIISIDPYPRAEIDAMCEKIYRVPFENMDLDFFSSLSSEDIFLVDNSHRSFANSDVTVFFTEVLPNLPSGMLYSLHDISLPYDYHQAFADLYYNEQYLLATYIIGGMMGDSLYLPLAFLTYGTNVLQHLEPVWGENTPLASVAKNGTFFWMRKK